MTRQLLIGALALTMVFACGGGSTSENVGAGTGGSTSSTSKSLVVQFKETEYTMAPSELTLKAGTYTFKIQNLGQFPHDLHVAATADGTEVGGSTVVVAGQTASFTITLKPGQYTMWCAVNAHRSLGMQGTLTVQ
ncbi:MAG TPA: cupredoxin domain-containing protein [Candidatus Dormibacteraeota bacterium]